MDYSLLGNNVLKDHSQPPRDAAHQILITPDVGQPTKGLVTRPPTSKTYVFRCGFSQRIAKHINFF
jgi:hypothetical protein